MLEPRDGFEHIERPGERPAGRDLATLSEVASA
jgi:hypothetical protein